MGPGDKRRVRPVACCCIPVCCRRRRHVDSTLTGRQVKWTGIDDGAGTIGAQKRQKTARRGDRVSSAEHVKKTVGSSGQATKTVGATYHGICWIGCLDRLDSNLTYDVRIFTTQYCWAYDDLDVATHCKGMASKVRPRGWCHLCAICRCNSMCAFVTSDHNFLRPTICLFVGFDSLFRLQSRT